MPTAPAIDPARLTDLVASLVRTNSVNPGLVPGAPGESAIAQRCASLLENAGLVVETLESTPMRPSVLATLPGARAGRSLMLNAHLDTVGVDGMTEPFSARIDGRRLHGRGAYDMKGAAAACIEAAAAVACSDIRLAGDLVVALVADEEVASLGMEEILARRTTDCAIVTEPTDLRLCLAHKGFAWFEVTTTGVAAHGSQHDLGVDANLRMGRFLARLDALERDLRARTPHPLVGPPTLHAATIAGGVGISTYSPRCTLRIERRLIPGETPQQAEAELRAIIDDLRREDPELRIDLRADLAREPFEADPNGPTARAVAAACRTVTGAAPAIIGENPWMDSALLQAAGVDTVVVGPGGAGAHAEQEWVDLDSVERLASILIESALSICGTT
ncbi:MAG: M20/M25/M40 family metallo-hydrolase [Phycisphaerales bacterium]